jgi:outer membrane protein OmpA-like peptidoglycan-associated protein
VSSQAKHTESRESALIWILVWLFGVIGIAWTGLNYAVPRFEQKLQTSVQQSISTFNSGPLIVSTKGRNVTLSGQVGSEEEKQLLVAAVNSAPGVSNVSSRLTLVEASSKPASSATDAAINVVVESDSTQPSIVVSQSPSLPTVQENTALPETTAEEEFPLKPEEADVVASNVTNNGVASAELAPSINIKVFDNILSIEGTMSTSDDTSSLVKSALDSFNLDVVSNGLMLDSEVGSAKWLIPLQGIMPLMGTMTNAHIGVTNQQLTLSGLAPTREIHDAIINEALASIGDFSLIEKISIQGESAGSNESTMILTAVADSDGIDDSIMKAEELARLATEAASKAKAEEQAKLATEAASKAKAEEQAKLAAEAASKAKTEKQARLAAEAAVAAKASEQARLVAEATAFAQAQEDERLAAKASAEAQALLAAEAVAKTKAAEQARLAAGAAAKANEQARLAAVVAAKVRAEERARLAAQAAAEQAAAARARADELARLKAAAKARSLELARLQAEATADAAAKAKLAQTNQSGGKVGLQQALQDLPSLRILFGTEGNRLTVDSLDILDQIAETIIQYPDTQVIIEGHTDATGEPDHNLRLSLLRATTVRDYLIRQGVSVYSLRAIGLGEAVPLIPNSNPEGRAKNRRIEFTFR